MDHHVRAGQELAARVVDLHLAQQCARGGVDGIGGAGEDAAKHLAGKLLERDGDRRARSRGLRLHLRHPDVDAQLVRGCQAKQLARLGRRPGLDQGADIGIARGDDAVERRVDALEPLQILQAADIGRVRLDGGGLRAEIADLLVGFLLGHGLGLQQRLPARRRRLREVEVRLRGVELGPRLAELLVDLRCLDLGQELALLDARADVDEPPLEIAAGARVDRRVREGARRPGQGQLVGGRALRRTRDGHDGNRRLLRRADEGGAGAPPILEAEIDRHAERDRGDADEPQRR